MKKLILSLLIPFTFFLSPLALQADQTCTIEMFWREWCAHCKDEKAFLEKLEKDWVHKFQYRNIADPAEKEKFLKLVEMEWLPKVVPLTFINWKVIQWFDTAETTWKEIESIIEQTKSETLVLLDDYLKNWTKKEVTVEAPKWTCSVDESWVEVCAAPEHQPKFVKVPFFGQVDVQKLSLGTASVVLWFIDWFNPCAMWVLIMFLTVLIQFNDKKKMFQVAGIFILAEAIMYYLILNVWFNAWDFVWMDAIITPIVWLVAIWAWLYFLYDWHTNPNAECKVWSLEEKRRTSKKIHELASKPMTIAVFFAILALAFSVNIFEFACSIGIPQTFTKILELNSLTFMKEQMYMFIYILFYMLDDFIVFGIALYSIEKIWLTNQYSRASHLIWWLLMLILGLILVIKPELLVF